MEYTLDIPMTLYMCKEGEDVDDEDSRERLELEYTGVPVKLDACNSQRLLEKPALDKLMTWIKWKQKDIWNYDHR